MGKKVNQVAEVIKLTIPEFVKKIDDATSCKFFMNEISGTFLLRVDGKPEIYQTPPIVGLSNEDFRLLMGKMEEMLEEAEVKSSKSGSSQCACSTHITGGPYSAEYEERVPNAACPVHHGDTNG